MAKSYELRMGTNTKIPLNGGICLNEETSISLTQSPHNGLLNMCLDNGGTLTKRKGQQYVLSSSIGDLPINGITLYKDDIYFMYNGSLRKVVGNTYVSIPCDIGQLSTNKANFFSYNGKLYIMEGSKYVYLDEATTSLKEVVPYIPTIVMNRKPDGSSSQVNESWNMLGTGFKESFNADGTSTTYKLSLSGLLSTTITATVNGTTITEGSGLTVNRTTGVITFTTAPTTGTNNVIITAYKFFDKLQDNIKKCNRAIEFSNRIFITGNDDLPNYYFAGGLSDNNDASYFPQKYMYAIKGSDSKVTGFKVHQNRLVVFKEDLTCTVEASTGLDNTASFPISYLNTEIGCDMPDTIQIINNDIVFCNSYGGVFVVASTIIPGEKSVLPISLNVNGDFNRNGILQFAKADLINATSADYDFKYWLCINDKVFVMDYKEGYSTRDPEKNRWFYYDNINASCFIIKDNDLVYGRRDIGQLAKFVPAYNDFGNGIKGVWKSKLMDFNYPDWLKMVSEIRATFSNNSTSPSTIKVNYLNENGNIEDTIIVPPNVTWSWNTFDWEALSWNVSLFDKTLKEKTKIKKICYFQLEFSNDLANENLAIKNLVINYKLIKRV